MTITRQWLETLNYGLPLNQKVSIRSQGKKRIRLSPLPPQEEPPNTLLLKREIGRRWTDLELIDMLKEVDLREKFSSLFRTSGSREVIDPETLQHRLLLCLFGLGTNVGSRASLMKSYVISNGNLSRKILCDRPSRRL